MATPTATLSSIWRALPSDITEQILTRLVDAHFHTDPAYTWSALRHLSAHQKRVLERRFATFWLPKLSITLYGRVTHQVEYRFLATSPDDAADAEHEDDAKATFAVPEDALRAIERRGGGWVDGGLRGMWADYDLTANRNVTVRLGEGLLNGGCWGGYMVNNTALPGLEVLEGGKIRFEWKRAVDELLREEMWMRRVGGEMFADAVKAWTARYPEQVLPQSDGRRGLAPTTQVLLWRKFVQPDRRVAVLMHRIKRAQRNRIAPMGLKFAAPSAKLHRQTPDPDDLAIVENWTCCRGCSRRHPPDIFEVVDVEESVVPQLEVFQRWLQQQDGGSGSVTGKGAVSVDTIAELYRDEYAWRRWIDSLPDNADELEEVDPEYFFRERSRDRSQWQSGLPPHIMGNGKVRWAHCSW